MQPLSLRPLSRESSAALKLYVLLVSPSSPNVPLLQTTAVGAVQGGLHAAYILQQ